MRFFTTLLCLQIFMMAHSQAKPETGRGNVPAPMLVINGVVSENQDLSSIDVETVATINIVKGAKIQNINSCRIPRDIILITTKAPLKGRFKIVDGSTGLGIPAASLAFEEGKTEQADENGMIVIDNLERGAELEATASCVGYKTTTIAFRNNSDSVRLITLEKDVKTMENVVVTAYGRTIRCRIGCICITTRTRGMAEEVEKKQESLLFFPVPARVGARITAILKSDTGLSVQVKIISLDGRVVFSGEKKPVSGRIEITPGNSLSRGAYIVQVIHPASREMETGKIILQ